MLCLAFFISCSSKKTNVVDSESSIRPFTGVLKPSTYVEYDNIDNPNEMHVILDQQRMLLNKTGQLFNPAGALIADFNLKGDIQLIFIWKDGPTLSVVTELNDGKKNWSEVQKYNLNDKRVEWNTRFGSFNLGVPIVVDSMMYLSTNGTLAKLNLETGAFVWKIDTLSNGSKYNGFEEPKFINSENILFASKIPFVDLVDTIIINEVNGSIVRKD